jgi:hypothetical protein
MDQANCQAPKIPKNIAALRFFGNYSPVIPAKAGIHDTVGLFIVKQSFQPVIPAKAGIHLVSSH